MTLQTKRGNAFDTASLLSALLRHSGIPTRYAYGTVEIPIDKVMNWVGGVTVPEAALQVLAQGGIPSVGSVKGGKIVAVRMEHIWVEAWVDMHPSRGARNRVGDSWVPMDTSFKQYEYIEPTIDISKNVILDTEALTNTITQNATINEAEGWVQGLDQGYAKITLENYQSEVQTYMNNQNTNATISEVLGSHKTIVKNTPIFSFGLPYKLIIKSNQYSVIPDNLRHKFKFVLNYGLNSGEIFTMIKSTPELAGKKLSLSFKPATQMDTDVLNSLMPKPHTDGSPINISELPISFPGHLINLIAEFSIGDNVILISPESFSMGTEVYSRTGLYSPNKNWVEKNNILIVGEYHTISLDLQGISSEQLINLKEKIELSKNKIESDNLEHITHHQISGDIIYSTVLSFFTMDDAKNKWFAKQNNIVQFRKVSYGSTGTSAEPEYYFGIPRLVKFIGINIDIDHSNSIVVDKNNDIINVIAFNRLKGLMLSILEHTALESIFSSNQKAISAAKALIIAESQGQKIYTITGANQGVINQLIVSDAVKNDINKAINNDFEVIVSGQNIQLDGWVGVGYIIVDPDTGSGAYKISGGSNGAFFILGASVGILTGIIISSFFPSSSPSSIVRGTALRAVLPWLIAISFFLALWAYNTNEDAFACFIGGVLLGVGIGSRDNPIIDGWVSDLVNVLAQLLINNNLRSCLGPLFGDD